MPIYQYEGKHYDLPDGLTKDQAIAKIEAHLGKAPKEAQAPEQAPVVAPEQAQEAPTAPAEEGGILSSLKQYLAGVTQKSMTPDYAGSKMGSVIEGALDPIYGTAQLAANVVGAGDYVNPGIKAREEAIAAANKGAGREGMDWMRALGGAASPANIVAASKLSQVLKPGMGTAAAVGGTMGAMAPTVGEDFASEKAKQVGIGAAGGAVGEKVIGTAGSLFKPNVSSGEKALTDLGVTLTPGQASGKGTLTRAAENLLEKIPFIGSKISTAKQEGIDAFNRGLINRTLGKVGAKLPDDVPLGHDAIARTRDILNQKYEEVLTPMSFKMTPKVVTGVQKAIKDTKLLKAGQDKEVLDIMTELWGDVKKTTLSGAEYKQLESDLAVEAGKYLKSSTIADNKIGEALKNASSAIREGLKTQNPKYVSALRAADSAYGDFKTLARAASASEAESGVFTPKHLKAAVKASDKSKDKLDSSKGRARLQGIAKAGVSQMTTPSSGMGTIGALGAFGAATGTVAATLGVGTAVPLAIATKLGTSAAYSPSFQKALYALIAERPELSQKLGQHILDKKALATYLSALGAQSSMGAPQQ